MAMVWVHLRRGLSTVDRFFCISVYEFGQINHRFELMSQVVVVTIDCCSVLSKKASPGLMKKTFNMPVSRRAT
jgi:hypothetical protein